MSRVRFVELPSIQEQLLIANEDGVARQPDHAFYKHGLRIHRIFVDDDVSPARWSGPRRDEDVAGRNQRLHRARFVSIDRKEDFRRNEEDGVTGDHYEQAADAGSLPTIAHEGKLSRGPDAAGAGSRMP